MDMNAFQSPEELLEDESFLAWYYKTDAVAFQRWQDHLSRNSSQKALADSAVELLEILNVQEMSVPVAQIEAAEQRLFSRIEERPVLIHLLPKRKISWRLWVSVAACFLVVLTAAWLDKYWVAAKSTISTPYGSILTKILPDGTEVTLNANSKFTYGRHWTEGSDREVWLNGEAFFHVTKTAQHDRFIVHADHFDVIVTGTKFDVITQPGDGRVALKEGGVTLRSEKGDTIQLIPGDVVLQVNGRWVRQSANMDDVTAWTDNKINFDNTPLSETIKLIEAHYGVKVEVADPKLLSKTLTGIFPNDNIDVFLKALEATKIYKITKDGDSIVIQSAY
jgi:transmembrane sensor